MGFPSIFRVAKYKKNSICRFAMAACGTDEPNGACVGAAPSPVPSPAPIQPATRIDLFTEHFLLIHFLDCGKTNKQTILKKLKLVKKVKTSLDCQKLCSNFSGCTHFVWKNNRKVAKRTCTLQTIGYKTKKNFVSGPVSC